MSAIEEIRPLLTADDVAATLRLSPKTVRKLAASGEIPSVRIAGSVRFRRDDLDALLERPAEHATHEESP
jgi:excisionase family DNA binding protein